MKKSRKLKWSSSFALLGVTSVVAITAASCSQATQKPQADTTKSSQPSSDKKTADTTAANSGDDKPTTPQPNNKPDENTHSTTFTNQDLAKIFVNQPITEGHETETPDSIAAKITGNYSELANYYSVSVPANIIVNQKSITAKVNGSNIDISLSASSNNQTANVTFQITNVYPPTSEIRTLLPDRVHTAAYDNLSAQEALNKIVVNGKVDQQQLELAYGTLPEHDKNIKLTYVSSRIVNSGTTVELSYSYSYGDSGSLDVVFLHITGFAMTVNQLADLFIGANASAASNDSSILVSQALVNPTQYYTIKTPQNANGGTATFVSAAANQNNKSAIDYTYNVSLPATSSQSVKTKQITITVKGFFSFVLPPSETKGLVSNSNPWSPINQKYYDSIGLQNMSQAQVSQFLQNNWNNSIASDVTNMLRVMFSQRTNTTALNQLRIEIKAGYNKGDRYAWTNGYMISFKFGNQVTWIFGSDSLEDRQIANFNPSAFDASVKSATTPTDNSTTFTWSWLLNNYQEQARNGGSTVVNGTVNGRGDLSFTLNEKQKVTLDSSGNAYITAVPVNAQYSQTSTNNKDFTKSANSGNQTVDLPIGQIMYWYYHQDQQQDFANSIVANYVAYFRGALTKSV
ncbi:hypothetical protein [[Mycoplasma] testudinis]|uniref:hypothetical protein n=1 Tax=[Mycoplasma] testudinis TaxID=33924 RepID=UPI0004810DC8|nr:hypothetical protein [[Mycoplasma] testudinis]